jgi:hypothetical protein
MYVKMHLLCFLFHTEDLADIQTSYGIYTKCLLLLECMVAMVVKKRGSFVVEFLGAVQMLIPSLFFFFSYMNKF